MPGTQLVQADTGLVREVADAFGGGAGDLQLVLPEPLDGEPGRAQPVGEVPGVPTRRTGMPLLRASAVRWACPLRPGCTARASSSAPTVRSGFSMR